MAASREREIGVRIAFGAAVTVLVLCAALALMVPIRRATRVDPILVLR